MTTERNDSGHVEPQHDDTTARAPSAARVSRVDPDCDAPLDEIVERCFDTAEGHAGWDRGTRLAWQCSGAFVADLLETHAEVCATAAGRADVRALARSLMLPLAHQRVALEWNAATGGAGAVAPGGSVEAVDESPADDRRRRAFKRGMLAGFLFGMADAVSRGIDGRALVEA